MAVRPVIPAEAVEAAAKYLSEFLSDYPADYSKEARELLEAAAPHMQAEAWEAGMAAAKLQAAGIKRARNPYHEEEL